MRVLLRLLLIPVGYVFGLTAATAVLVLGTWLPWLSTAKGVEEQTLTLFGLAAEGGGVFVLASVFAFLPALAAVIIAEAFSIRSVFYYAAAAMLIAIAPWSLVDTGGADFYAPEAVAGASLAGGLVYWFIAGQSAGFSAPANQPD